MPSALIEEHLQDDKVIKTKASRNPFDTLVAELSRILGKSGLDSEDVDVEELLKMMERYLSCEDDWKRFAFKDPSRGYTRNLVDEGNGKSNLLLLVWSPGKSSYIHDHADAHCIMRILKGCLVETRYDLLPSATAPPRVKAETAYHAGQVTYMADELGVHKISNPDPENFSVSLHLYTPPNAAKYGCNIIDERTGKMSHVEQNNFFSRFGEKI